MKLLLLLFLILLIGCAKSPCVIAVDVTFKNAVDSISATAYKKVKCGERLSFPFHDNVATKLPAFIEVHFFQGARVVRADVVYGSDFKNNIFFLEYEFPDTNPDTMVWKVYDVDRSGWVQYSTPIK